MLQLRMLMSGNRGRGRCAAAKLSVRPPHVAWVALAGNHFVIYRAVLILETC